MEWFDIDFWKPIEKDNKQRFFAFPGIGTVN